MPRLALMRRRLRRLQLTTNPFLSESTCLFVSCPCQILPRDASLERLYANTTSTVVASMRVTR